MIITAVMTCGRLEYLAQTLASYSAQVHSDAVTRVVIFDDSGDVEFFDQLLDLASLAGLDDLSIVRWGRNQGAARARDKTWRWLAAHCVEPYVFLLEEDFTFDEPVDLSALAALLDAQPQLDQVALLRQPWFPGEVRAGGIIERNPERYTYRADGSVRWVEHDMWFTLNPSVFRRSLCAEGWPIIPRSEWAFSRRRADELGRRFAFWGEGRPQITHIGVERTERRL